MPNRYQASDDKRQAVLEGALAQENNTLEAEGNDLTSDNPSRRPENSISAWIFMLQMVHKYPSTGALTNIPLAARMDPQFASLAKDLMIMYQYHDRLLLRSDCCLDNIFIAGNVANRVFRPSSPWKQSSPSLEVDTAYGSPNYGTIHMTSADLKWDRSMGLSSDGLVLCRKYFGLA
ncbi:hypothetical protein N7530_010668 [Penicillium desertorum]|uniref:Uncharacterized protein n=1 Tax=Penicillium desertorum TaxID=1303715 RepID=A0A9W9WHU8_9EURO|nr:hypothetical protein N7530_010668 [Penicillium desertorum]